MAGKVTACKMSVATGGSGHQCVGNAVSVCITPAAPSPVPIPYPLVAPINGQVKDAPVRTKVNGKPILTVGGTIGACNGNQPGTLKEVVSLNTGGPCFPVLGIPVVLTELGMTCTTGSLAIMNKQGVAMGGGGGGGGGGAGGGGGGGGPSGSASAPSGPAPPAAPRGGKGGSASTASAGAGGGGSGGGLPSGVSSKEAERAAAEGAEPDQVAARKKLAAAFYKDNCPSMKPGQMRSHMKGIDFNKPVKTVRIPPDGGGAQGDTLYHYGDPRGGTGQYFTTDPRATPEQLGVNSRVLVPASGNTPPRIVPREKRAAVVGQQQPASGLQSTAAPVKDTWSHSGEPKETSGGGAQVFVPRSQQGGLK